MHIRHPITALVELVHCSHSLQSTFPLLIDNMDWAYPLTIGDRVDNASLKQFQNFISEPHLLYLGSTFFGVQLRVYGHLPLKYDAYTQ